MDMKTPTASNVSMSSDLTFVTNEQGKRLSDRFSVLLGSNTRFFDCLVGYFFISGFHKLHPALSKTEKIRILIGIQTDRTTYELIQTAKEQQEFAWNPMPTSGSRCPVEFSPNFRNPGIVQRLRMASANSWSGSKLANWKCALFLRSVSMPSFM